MRKKQKGFTFIELLVAVTIIMVITGVGLVNYRITSQKSRDAKRKADLESIRSALELCRAENGTYPAAIDTTVTCNAQVYLNPVPTDPKDDQGTFGYTYTRTSTTTYTLCATVMESDGETSPYCVTNP